MIMADLPSLINMAQRKASFWDSPKIPVRAGQGSADQPDLCGGAIKVSTPPRRRKFQAAGAGAGAAGAGQAGQAELAGAGAAGAGAGQAGAGAAGAGQAGAGHGMSADRVCQLDACQLDAGQLDASQPASQTRPDTPLHGVCPVCPAGI